MTDSRSVDMGSKPIFPTMMKFQVKSIEDMISYYPKLGRDYSYREGEIQVIVITRNKYNYNFKPLLVLDFDDITSEYKPVGTMPIQKRHIESIIERLPKIKKANLVFVCCDAGLSRSPAVAKALSHYLCDLNSFNHLAYRYPFANKDVFETLLLGLKSPHSLVDKAADF